MQFGDWLIAMLLALAPWVVRSAVKLTTLFAAWCWMHVAAWSIAALFCVEASTPTTVGTLAPHLRYAAAVITCLPMTAVLGAKKPQHHAWQAIVAALAMVLFLPIAQSFAFPSPTGFSPHPAWLSFVILMFAMGPLNYAGGPRFLSASLFFLGQLSVLSPFLPLLTQFQLFCFRASPACFFLASCLLELGYQYWQPRRTGWNGAWLDLRDLYGAFWGFRLIERAHEFSQQFHSPWVLGWRGFYFSPTEVSQAIKESPRDVGENGKHDEHKTTVHSDCEITDRYLLSVRGVWKRFVEESWIAQRVNGNELLTMQR